MRHPFDRTSLMQGGLAVLYVLILLFLAFVPASEAQAAIARFAF